MLKAILAINNFCYNIFMRSTNITFDWLDDDEQVDRIIYKHWASIGVILFSIIATFLILIAFVFLSPIFSTLSNSWFNISGLLSVISIILIAITMATIYIWRANMVVYTNKNIVEIEQKGLFSRSISSLKIKNIQDVKAEQVGVLAKIFNYGTITIQSAGEILNFRFTYNPDPFALKEYIMDLYQKVCAQEQKISSLQGSDSKATNNNLSHKV